jgi:hypothetical protein
MPSNDIISSLLTKSHTPAIDNNQGKLWFVICGDNDFVGYWDEDNFDESMGWSAEEVSEILAMNKGETLPSYSSSMHTIICVK